VLGGQPETIARYAELCRFKTKLKIEQGGTCEAVLELEQKQKGE
jgi:sugar diacid utilization regulator